MAVIKKDYLTFAELRGHWGITDADMHYLISKSDLVPSIVWNDGLLPVSLKLQANGNFDVTKGPDYFGEMKYLPQGSQVPHKCFMHLHIPLKTGADSYSFRYVSNLIALPLGDTGDVTLYQMSTRDLVQVELDQIKVQLKAVFLSSEISRCESLHPELCRQLEPKADNEQASNKWPWGNHETNLLRKLSEAADKWWKNYDPSDNTTAPTNKQVSDWLESQGVARRTAEVMATILRDDNLPTGPRK